MLTYTINGGKNIKLLKSFMDGPLTVGKLIKWQEDDSNTRQTDRPFFKKRSVTDLFS